MNHTKTAVSIPHDLFEQSEQLAAQLGISRSELYAQALRALVRERKIDAAREQLDQDLRSLDQSMRAEDLHDTAAATIRRAAERGESTW